MLKMALAGWFIIRVYSMDGDKHTYLVEDPIHNYNIAMALDQPLSYGENTWIKLKMIVDCTEGQDYTHLEGVQAPLYFRTYTCNAEQVRELKCTVRNSFIINGVPYC